MASSKNSNENRESFINGLKNSGIIKLDTTIEDLLDASGTIRDGDGTKKTIVYDDDKYFAVMK